MPLQYNNVLHVAVQAVMFLPNAFLFIVALQGLVEGGILVMLQH